MSSIKQIPSCSSCGSENVLIDAFAEWSVKKQEWVLQNTFDHTVCEQCEGECSLSWEEVVPLSF